MNKILLLIILAIVCLTVKNGNILLKKNRSNLNQIYSVKNSGAKGDGITDDTHAIEKAINHCIKNNLVCSIPKTSKFYNIKSTIRVSLEPGQTINIVSNGAIIKPLTPPVNNSAYNLTSFNEHVFLSIGKKISSVQSTEMFANSKNTTIKISGLVFDGSNLKSVFAAATYKTDIFIGLQLLAENVTVNNCVFKDIYGYGLRIHNVLNSTTTNCKFLNVGGRGATMFAQNKDLDALGDGIYHALVKKNGNVNIMNCVLQGKKMLNKRSRSAITFEYSTQPYKILLSNLTISGYAKGFHIEETAPTTININKVNLSDFNFGIVNVLNNATKVYFNNSKMYTGLNDGNDNGDALAFLNYESKAKIYVDNSFLDFNGKKGAYQSAVGLTEVKNSIIDGNNTNFFFADGKTLFSNCTFVDFGGEGKSFFSDHEGSGYRLKNSILKSSPKIRAEGKYIKLNIEGSVN